MTLRITSNKIIIENNIGQTKFNSDNHLLYKKAYSTGSISLNAGTPSVNKPLGFSVDASTIYSIYIKMTSCSGSIGNSLIGVKIPLSGAMPIHWEGFVASNTPAAAQENLEVIVDQGYLKAQTVFYPHIGETVKTGEQSLSFTYEVNAYTHQDIQ